MNIYTDWVWSSHQPLIKTILEVFDPKFILEFGSGNFSTALFHTTNFEKMISIDNDKEWINLITPKYSKNEKWEIRFHDLGNEINIATDPHALSSSKIEEINSYYKSLIPEIIKQSNIKLMFVDQYTCNRILSIETLYSYFDIILYHDCEEPVGVQCYNYNFNDDLNTMYNHYKLHTNGPWTGCFIKKHIDINKLDNYIKKHILEYCSENNLNTQNFSFKQHN